MEFLTLCRANADGIEYKIVRVCWTGRGGGYTYRVYRKRRKVTKEDFSSAFLAMAFLRGMIEVSIKDLDERSKQ